MNSGKIFLCVFLVIVLSVTYPCFVSSSDGQGCEKPHYRGDASCEGSGFSFLEGKVRITSGDDSLRYASYCSLPGKETVETGRGSFSEITLPGGIVVQILGETVLGLDSGEESVSLKLHHGSVRIKTREAALRVITHSAVVYAAGDAADFALILDTEDEALIDLFSGAVEIAGKAARENIIRPNAGKYISVSAGGIPEVKGDIPSLRRIRWELFELRKDVSGLKRRKQALAAELEHLESEKSPSCDVPFEVKEKKDAIDGIERDIKRVSELKKKLEEREGQGR